MMTPLPTPILSEQEQRDADVLARTVFGEARGESDLGRLAVAWVCRNRAVIAGRFVAAHGHPHPLFGDGTVAGACERSNVTRDGRRVWQFSCWDPADPNCAKLLALDLTGEAARPSRWAATTALERTAPDPSNGATHYHTAMAPRDGIDWPPYWAVGQTVVATVGSHVFYRLG
jgi:cell wall hydrolase